MKKLLLEKHILTELSNAKLANNWTWGTKGDFTVFCNGNAIYYIKKCALYPYALKHDSLTLATIKRLEEAGAVAKKATISSERLKILNVRGKGMGELAILKADDNDVYVDVSLIKWFDTNAVYSVINGTSPIYVEENDELVGIVLPVVRRRLK